MTNNSPLTTYDDMRTWEKRVVSRQSFVVSQRNGQSLIEVIIGLGIGAVLIGAGAFAIATMLRSSLATEKYAAASAFSQELMDAVRSYTAGGWQNLYGLTKGSSTTYFLSATGSSYMVVNGEEGLLDNDVTDGLAGKWGFDETEAATSTTYDASGNGNNGTLVGSPTRTSSCKVGNCLSFSSSTSDYVRVWDTNPGAGGLDFGTGDFSVSAWVYTPTLDVSDNTYLLVNKWDYSVSTGGWGLGTRYGTYTFQLGDAGSCNVSWYASTTAAVTPGVWEQVLVTVDRTGYLVIYVDGASKYQADISAHSSCSVTNAFNLNVSGRQGSYLFSGMIDDVRVYNRAITSEEAKRLDASGIYKRFFAVENVCRVTEASSTISGTAPCVAGTVEDSSTQQITVYTQWTAAGNTSEAKIVGFFTRTRNAVFQQTDWSGGSGAAGAFTAAPSSYVTGSNVSSTAGSLEIQSLTQE